MDGGGIEQISGGGRAFAALTSSGRVVTWGVAETGGDSRKVQNKLACQS